jgi:cell division septation protein DedD
MATRNREKSEKREKTEKTEKTELVSFWVNVVVVGIVMIVLGFYLGTYMLHIWKSGDTVVTPDLSTTSEATGAADQDRQAGQSGVLGALPSSEPGSAPSQSSTASTGSSSASSSSSAERSDQPVVQSSATSLPATSSSLYKVQVGSFDDRESAEVMAGKLKREGYADAWVTSTVPYRVQVGAYSNPDNATKIVRQLETAGYSVHIVN